MRRFQYIVLEVTEACPHACLHCYNYWRDDRAPVRAHDTLTRSEIRDLVRRIKADTRLRNVALSGGEPLMRADIAGICKDLVDEGLGVTVITSGVLLTSRRAAMFPAGTTFEMTLFCADPELHDRIAGRRGAFRRVLDGVICARENGHQVAISVVVNRLNAHLVRDALELGIAIGGEAFLLNRMNLTRHTLGAGDRLAPSSTQLKQALAAAESVARDFGASIAVSVPIPPCVADPEPYPHLHFGWCPRGGKNAYYTVSHNGLLRPCNHSSAILGDLRTQSFEDIVRSRPAAAYWSGAPVECRACEHPLSKACRGGCPAASRECFGDGSVMDPIVNIALASNST